MSVLLAVLAVATARPAPHVVKASAEDCVLIVEVGKIEHVLSSRGEKEPLVIDIEEPGQPTYREDCPWRRLGVAPPIPATDRSATAVKIVQPDYGPDRLTAVVTFVSEVGRTTQFGPGVAATQYRLVKKNGRWQTP
jgi:hypothetical protein